MSSGRQLCVCSWHASMRSRARSSIRAWTLRLCRIQRALEHRSARQHRHMLQGGRRRPFNILRHSGRLCITGPRSSRQFFVIKDRKWMLVCSLYASTLSGRNRFRRVLCSTTLALGTDLGSQVFGSHKMAGRVDRAVRTFMRSVTTHRAGHGSLSRASTAYVSGIVLE